MTLQASIYQSLSIRGALAKPFFSPMSAPFFIPKAKSRLRIGFYEVKPTPTGYACTDVVIKIMPISKMRKVGFVLFFVDQDGPRLKPISTNYCK